MFYYSNGMHYSEEEIKLAIDIASGDDGYMSIKVIEILKALTKEEKGEE